jgi:iron complex transport system substrate-binding protein
MSLPRLLKETHPEFYNGLKVFRQKKVYVLHPFNSYVTNIDTAMTDSYAVGKILYAERFSDVEIRKRADEIYSFLLGKPIYDKMEKVFGPLGSVLSFRA